MSVAVSELRTPRHRRDASSAQVFLNVLIAIVSDSYDLSMAKAEGLFLRSRCELITETALIASLLPTRLLPTHDIATIKASLATTLRRATRQADDDPNRLNYTINAVVSNHVAVYDPWTLMCCVGPVAFVARQGLFDVPVVGRVLTAMGAVGVDRRATASPGGGGARREISERLSGDSEVRWPLLIFPEGATTTGRGLAAFRSGAFAPRAPVLPVVISYTCQSGFDLSYTDNQSTASAVLWHFVRSLLERGKTIDVRVLEPLRPTPLMRTDAATYAGAVRAAMLDAMPGARDWHDWDNRRMRDAWYGADAAAKD